MNLQPITMPKYQARELARKYREAVEAARLKRRLKAIESGGGSELSIMRSNITDQEREDDELAKAYAALAQGAKLIDVPQVIRDGGLDARSLPKLAICRADAKECWLQIHSERATFAPEQISTWGVHWRRKDVFAIASRRLPSQLANLQWRSRNNVPTAASALVPLVPIALRPDDLSKYWILWEAEWTARAPVDPILLKRVSVNLFAVIAQWDLTPLEQRVLEGRLGSR